MGWQVGAIVVCLLTGHWVIAALLALSMLFHHRSAAPLPQASMSSAPTPVSSLPSPSLHSPLEAIDALILRRELECQFAAGTVTREFYTHVLAQIAILERETLHRQTITPGSHRWHRGRESAWRALQQRGLLSPGPTPWQKESPTRPEPSGQPAQQLSFPFLTSSASTKKERVEKQTSTVTVSPSTPARRANPMPSLSTEAATRLQEAPQLPPPVPPRLSQPSSTRDSLATTPPSMSTIRQETAGPRREDYAWKPTTPSALERALHTVSGWPALVIPFLVQNILWFIGGLCFVAGSVFLVASTAGFVKGLAVSAILLLYTVIILWGGYQIRRRQPHLLVASNVLLTVGMLLLPLNVAASVRLFLNADSPWTLLISGLGTTAIVWGLYHATTLVSGLTERALQGRHPHLFWGLTVLQLTLPLIMRFPWWPVLAFLHLCILGLLAYGLVAFIREWLHSIFVERHTVAYYAAGSLVYAAVVSFAHLTWGAPTAPALPGGYYGPVLMAVCALLFFVDAHLKQWSTQVAFLSRISFILYGLSVLALLLSVSIPSARIVTMLLASGVYGFVAWHYQTRTPLLLFLTCWGGLYGDVILRHVAPQWHLFAGLPGLFALFALSRWLQQRRSLTLALVGYRITLTTAVLLTAWSLVHAQPGLVALGTALTLMALLFYGLRFIGLPTTAMPVVPATLALPNSSWSYSVSLMGSIAAAYAPVWLGLGWTMQCAFLFVLLAGLWSLIGLRNFQRGISQNRTMSEILLNSALLNIGAACALTIPLLLPDLPVHRTVPLLYTLMGGVCLCLSLTLRVQWLFYSALGLGSVAGVIVKLMYFPASGTGVIELSLAVSVGILVWWIDTRALTEQDISFTPIPSPPLLTLLWQFPVSSQKTTAALLRVPLQQAMTVLWVIGLLHLGIGIFSGQVGWAWSVSAALGAIGAVLGAGSFTFPPLLSAAVLLSLGSVLNAAIQCGSFSLGSVTLIGTLFLFASWELSLFLFSRPAAVRLAEVLHWNSDRTISECYLYWTTLVSILFLLVVTLGYYGFLVPSVSLLLLLLTSMLFLGLSGWRSQQRLQSYCLLGIAVLTTILSYAWIAVVWQPMNVAALSRNPALGLLVVTESFLFWLLASVISRRARRCEGTPWASAQSLYHGPLHIVALVLAICAGSQQLGLTWGQTSSSFSFLSPWVLFLAGSMTIPINHTLRYPFLNIFGLFCVTLGVLWVETWMVHRTSLTAFPVDRARADQWLTLSLIALGLAYTALIVERRSGKSAENQSWWTLFVEAKAGPTSVPFPALYIHPLQVIATLTYGWALAGALSLFVVEFPRGSTLLSGAFFLLTSVAFLLFHRNGWSGFPWLAGLTALNAGLIGNNALLRLLLPLLPVVEDSWNVSLASGFQLVHLLWVNILLGSLFWGQRQRVKWATQWVWLQDELLKLLLFWPATFLLVTLVLAFGYEADGLLWAGQPHRVSLPLFFSLETGILTLSFLHLWWIRKTLWSSHTFLASCLCFTLAFWLTFLSSLFHLPLLLTLWSGILLLVHERWQRQQQRFVVVQSLVHAVSRWIVPSWGAAFSVLAVAPGVPFPERMISLALLTIFTGVYGWQRQDRPWLVTTFILFLLLMHGWPPVWVSFSQALRLLPWYALVCAGLSWLTLWAHDIASQRTSLQPNSAEPSNSFTALLPRFAFLATLLAGAWPAFASLAVLEWLLHEGLFFSSFLTSGQWQGFLGTGEVGAALSAATLLLAVGLYQNRKTQQTIWLSAVLLFAGAVGLYLRLLFVGLAPASLWDTAMLMIITYCLFALYCWTHAEPLLYAIMVLPFFTLLTVPLQLNSLHASLTFFTTSVVYLLAHSASARELPLYLAFLTFNAALYLWVPGWASHYQSLQMYALPITLSILVLLHLHRDDLQPHILNSTRLATLSLLYASATLDVFRQDSFFVFAGMVMLSLTGIVVGIALRTRAFLYSGTAFFILNILSQLFLHIPEHKLGRAFLLLILGTAVIGMSIWFSWQKEQILQRVRIFRADLETWG